MGKSLTEKIIENHLRIGKPTAGEEIGIRIDQTLTQDATGTMAYLQFEAMNIPAVRTELSVSYIDHNTTQIGFENADDHRYLQSVARKFGIYLSRPGNGICHQVHLERFGKPGKTLIGSDSHTPTCGAMGMLAMGAGGLDVAMAMAGEPFYLQYPRIIRINLTGKLGPWVSAKDIILQVLSILTTRGNVGSVLEYGGAGIETLTVPERATITNMGAECGVTTSLFPSDEMTRRFLAAQDRQEDFLSLKADDDAVYDRIINIELSELEPMAAGPHSPDNVMKVRDIGPMEVDQVCIGSCTNSSYKDLVTVAKILKGRVAHPGVSLVIAPGSRQVLENIAAGGYLTDLIASGARLMENACGFCIGNGQSPPSGAVSLRTSNRNFYGRSGTKDAEVYLVSPETAAAAVITGSITDPRDLPRTYPDVAMPERFFVDDRMIIKPTDTADPAAIEIIRGPNIGTPPESQRPLADMIEGVLTIKLGDKITTDHIIPAGERMKYRSNIAAYSRYVFEIVDPGFADRASAVKGQGLANIIVAGWSYGQGSSREHAAICPMYLGVKAVIAKSFERIHAANLINFGIVPLVFCKEEEYELLIQGDRLEIPDVRERIGRGEALIVNDTTRGFSFQVHYELTDRQRQMILAGGALNMRKA
ncbi:MAG: aconitate hydratase [Syntrophales bacterium]|nr:aconitate hydratase [Syntrophales bacterium]